MPQANIYLDKEEDEILKEKSKEWNVKSKADTIKKLIRDSKEQN